MIIRKIEDQYAILWRNGVLIEAQLYAYKHMVVAKHGSGYIRLYANGSTSVKNINIVELVPAEFYKDNLGRLCLVGFELSEAEYKNLKGK